MIPYLAPTVAIFARGLPSIGKPAPIIVPSAPNLNLFLNLASAKSLPSKPSSLSFSKTNGPSSFICLAPEVIKSVAPKAVAIYPARFAMSDPLAVVPVALAAAFASLAFLPLRSFLALFIILNTPPPGTPYSIKTLFTVPSNVSGS